MPQSLSNLLVHVIFSTKNRKRFIRNDVKADLYQYMTGIIKSFDAYVHEIGGIEDHVHILMTLPRTIALSKIVEDLKKGSSKWLKTKGRDYRTFSWQNGYGAFSLGQSNYDKIAKYIQNQEEHHKTKSFEDEYRSFLRKYQIKFDERYVWD